MNEVAKVFLATNSDYKYTDVSLLMQEHNYPPQMQNVIRFLLFTPASKPPSDYTNLA